MDTGSDSATIVVVALRVGGALLASLSVAIVASALVKDADGGTVGGFAATIFVILLLLAILFQNQLVHSMTSGA